MVAALEKKEVQKAMVATAASRVEELRAVEQGLRTAAQEMQAQEDGLLLQLTGVRAQRAQITEQLAQVEQEAAAASNDEIDAHARLRQMNLDIENLERALLNQLKRKFSSSSPGPNPKTQRTAGPSSWYFATTFTTL